MNKARKKPLPAKSLKDTKRKDEIDKENLEKVISKLFFLVSN